ncbi:MAG: class I SAM-dependent methyltransferase [Candidatus Bathyarchaeota archaeon]|nr:class I SAM-dependent methyltransferase [Candidatus Bathyarchaeota archaeon]
MNERKKSEDLWDKRERFEQTPDRYREIACKKPVAQVLERLGSQWRKDCLWINYADLGCGEGKGTKFFSEFLVKTVGLPVKSIGVDASAICAVPCRERGIDFCKVELGAEPLNLSDYQVITLFETIEHVFNTDKLLESIRQSISKDGVLLVTTLNVVCLKNRLLVPLGIQPFNTEVSTKKLSYGYKYKSLRQRMDTWKPAGHIRPFTLYSLTEMLEENGFKVLKSLGLENWRTLKVLEHVAKNMCTGILVVAVPS